VDLMYKRSRLMLVFLVIGGTAVWLLTSMFEAHPIGVAAAVHHELIRHKADGERCVIPSSATPGRVEHLLGILTNTRERSLQIPPEDNMVNMVVTFAYMLDINREGINRSSLEERQNEFLDSMWRNLHHERVWSIHILYEQNKHMQYLIKSVMERAEKSVAATAIDIPDTEDCSPSLSASAGVVALLKQKVFMTVLEDGKVLEYKRAFEYANQYLSGTLYSFGKVPLLTWMFVGLVAWIGNSDIYLGDGWEQLSVANMKSKSKAYSLTRQEVCPHKTENCAHSENQRNGGSDCFVVVPPVADHLLEAMDHPTNVWGAENNVIYQLSRGGYHVSNPCNIINIIHNHCSGNRPNEATVRVNVPNGRRGSGVSRPTSSL